jgi:hypothetical protein
MRTADVKGYDLIGDVHGCASTLRCLFERLGYVYRDNCYRHPERQAIFIGDIVDRGNYICESLQIVRDMVDAGSAQIVIGNHEYNAIVYCTKSALGSDYLREHNDRNFRQIERTLEQFANFADQWQDYLAWFRTLPIYLEVENFRVIHACWDQRLINELKAKKINDFSDDEFLYQSVEWGSFASKVADRLLRGTYLRLPENATIRSEDGINRRTYRTKFWSVDPKCHQDVVFQPDPLPAHIVNLALTEQEKEKLLHYNCSQPSLFVGHYWQKGQPLPITENIACIDYSAVKYGKLVAYRMDQETRLDANKFVWVDVAASDID